MQPSIGHIVHYVAHGTPVRADGTQAYPPACRAAIITEAVPLPAGPGARLIEDGYDVSLMVANPTGQFFNQHVPYDQWDSGEALPEAQPQGGSWHWCERAGEVAG